MHAVLSNIHSRGTSLSTHEKRTLMTWKMRSEPWWPWVCKCPSAVLLGFLLVWHMGNTHYGLLSSVCHKSHLNTFVIKHHTIIITVFLMCAQGHTISINFRENSLFWLVELMWMQGGHLHLLSINQSKASILMDVSDYCVPLRTP